MDSSLVDSVESDGLFLHGHTSTLNHFNGFILINLVAFENQIQQVILLISPSYTFSAN